MQLLRSQRTLTCSILSLVPKCQVRNQNPDCYRIFVNSSCMRGEGAFSGELSVRKQLSRFYNTLHATLCANMDHLHKSSVWYVMVTLYWTENLTRWRQLEAGQDATESYYDISNRHHPAFRSATKQSPLPRQHDKRSL